MEVGLPLDEFPEEILQHIYQYITCPADQLAFIRSSPQFYFRFPYVTRLFFVRSALHIILGRKMDTFQKGVKCPDCGIGPKGFHKPGDERNRHACPLRLVYDAEHKEFNFQGALEYLAECPQQVPRGQNNAQGTEDGIDNASAHGAQQDGELANKSV